MKYDVDFKKHINEVYKAKIESNRRYSIIELELTNKCGNNCFYCGVFNGAQISEMNFDDLKAFIKTVSSEYSTKGTIPIFSLCGGDPVEYSCFRELLEFLKDMKLNFIIKANCSTVNTKIIGELLDKGCRGVGFTIMGGVELHDDIRSGDTISELFFKTKLLKTSGIPVVWNFTVGKFNLDEISEVLPLVLEIKPDAISIGRIAKIGKLKESNCGDITSVEYKNFLLKILDFYYNNYTNGVKINFSEQLWIPLLVEEGILDIKKLQTQGIELGCDAYCSTAYTISSKGEILLCGLMPSIKVGSIKNYNTSGIFKDKLLSIKNPSPCHECKYCNYCRGCPAIAYANTGSLYNKDPQCWVKEDVRKNAEN